MTQTCWVGWDSGCGGEAHRDDVHGLLGAGHPDEVADGVDGEARAPERPVELGEGLGGGRG